MFQVSSVIGVLGWDQETMMPPGAAAQRAEQLAYFQSHLHSLVIEEAYFQKLEKFLQTKNLSESEQAAARLLHRKSRRSRLVPQKLVEEIARAEVMGHEAWIDARKKSDFKAFQPHLEKVVALKMQLGNCLKEGTQTPYEALLEEFEPDWPLTHMDELFKKLRNDLVPLIPIIREHQKPASGLSFKMPAAMQKEMTKITLKLMGYDFERGRVDTAVHPFCSGAGTDIRITSRYDENDWTDALGTALHEGGHALYEQGMTAILGVNPLAEATGFGMHESQSRFWENHIGRNRVFCKFIVPHLEKELKTSLGVRGDDLYEHMNHVEPSYIRVSSDEATYNLHIIVRFELEEALFRGDIKVGDLKDAWNDRVTKYFQLPVPKDSDGVLQDTHWSTGSFGYFPTYTLGNLIAAQLNQQIRSEISVDEEIGKGNFHVIKAWLNKKVHANGSLKNTRDLVKQITKRDVETQPFISYLKSKYLASTS